MRRPAKQKPDRPSSLFQTPNSKFSEIAMRARLAAHGETCPRRIHKILRGAMHSLREYVFSALRYPQCIRLFIFSHRQGYDKLHIEPLIRRQFRRFSAGTKLQILHGKSRSHAVRLYVVSTCYIWIAHFVSKTAAGIDAHFK